MAAGKFTRHPDLHRLGTRHTVQRPVSTKPTVPAGDPEYERSQPINRDDRRAMLQRHFEAGGMTNAQIEAALNKAKV